MWNKLFKRSLKNFLLITGTFFPFAFSIFHISKNSENKLELKYTDENWNIDDSQKLFVNNRDTIYVNNSNYKEILKVYFKSVFLNDFSFYYDFVSNFVNENLFLNRKKCVFIYNSFSDDYNKLNFTYLLKVDMINNYVYTNDWDYMRNLKLIKSGFNEYYPSFELTIGIANENSFEILPNISTNEPLETKTLEYDNKIFKIKESFTAFTTFFEKTTLEFPQIRIINLSQYNFDPNLLTNKNIYLLNQSELYNSFKINEYIPINIVYEIVKYDNSNLEINVSSLKFNIENKLQSLNFFYIGSFKIKFFEKFLYFDFSLIETYLDIFNIENKYFEYLICDENLKKWIKGIKVEKNYLSNFIIITLLFNENEIKNWLFYDLFLDEFYNKKYEIKFNNNTYISIENDVNKKTSIQNWDESMILIESLDNSKLEILDFCVMNVVKNEQNNEIGLSLLINILYENIPKQIELNVKLINFANYNSFNFEKFIKEKFLDENTGEINYSMLSDFFLISEEWKNIFGEKLYINLDKFSINYYENFTEIEIEITDFYKKTIFSEKVRIDNHNKNEVINNGKEKNTNWYYLIIIFIIFFISVFIIFILKKKIKNKNKDKI